MNWVATFHTHLAALRSQRRLTGQGIKARLAPVPRALSSSCGTCVFYESEESVTGLLDEDLEAVYEKREEGYRLICSKQD